VLAAMLEELGCETILARSGTEALGTIAEDQTMFWLPTLTCRGWMDQHLQHARGIFDPNWQ